MSNYSQAEYWQDVQDIAEGACNPDLDRDMGEDHDFIWDSVDGSAWIIWEYANQKLLSYSPNENAIDGSGYEPNMEKGVNHIFMVAAFYAMMADVTDAMYKIQEEEEYEEEVPTEPARSKQSAKSDEIELRSLQEQIHYTPPPLTLLTCT